MPGPGDLRLGRRVLFLRPLLEPGSQLRLLQKVRIETGDPLSDNNQAVQHLDGEVPASGNPGEFSLRLHPGKVPMDAGTADLFIGIPDAVEAAPIQRTQGSVAGFVKRASLAAGGRHDLRCLPA